MCSRTYYIINELLDITLEQSRSFQTMFLIFVCIISYVLLVMLNCQILHFVYVKRVRSASLFLKTSHTTIQSWTMQFSLNIQCRMMQFCAESCVLGFSPSWCYLLSKKQLRSGEIRGEEMRTLISGVPELMFSSLLLHGLLPFLA